MSIIMRIKLKKGKQRDLICKFKNKNKFTWKKFSDYLKTSESSLIEWKYENSLMPLNIFERLDNEGKYKKFILEIKKENWGQINGGNNSKGNTKEIKHPKKNAELAELVGIILGDGNVASHIYSKKKRTYSIKIAGDLKKDIEYLNLFVKPMIERLFEIKTRNYSYPKKNGYYIIADGIELIKFFKLMGLNSGNKIKNNQGIPEWIKTNRIYLQNCLRGLIDTDGSIHRMSKRDSNLLRISFKSNIPLLLADFLEAFKKLGYNPNLIKSSNQVFLSRQNEIKKYVKEIGFSNKKHLNRLHEFRNTNSLVV